MPTFALRSLPLCLLLATSASAAAPPVERPTTVTLRYVRPAKDSFVLESKITLVTTRRGTTYASLTDRVSEKMTLTIQLTADHKVLHAEAVRETDEGRQSARVVFDENGAALTRRDETERLKVPADAVVTTAPDWSDVLWVILRYDRGKGGKQSFAGLWIHPVQATRQLSFDVTREKSEAVEVDGREVPLDRYRVVLRSGAYLVWADRAGRVVRLMPPDRPQASVILEGYEKATAKLR